MKICIGGWVMQNRQPAVIKTLIRTNGFLAKLDPGPRCANDQLQAEVQERMKAEAIVQQ